jgi:hypothetical protein
MLQTTVVGHTLLYSEYRKLSRHTEIFQNFSVSVIEHIRGLSHKKIRFTNLLHAMMAAFRTFPSL